jgi:flagellar biosynthetic protein FliR
MHHLLFFGLMESYQMFPVGAIPDTGSMAEMISRSISESFKIGIQIASPFLVVSMLIYICMGVLSRLMPQVQVFMLVMPLQILISLITFSLVISASMLFWMHKFEDGMVFFLSGGG